MRGEGKLKDKWKRKRRTVIVDECLSSSESRYGQFHPEGTLSRFDTILLETEFSSIIVNPCNAFDQSGLSFGNLSVNSGICQTICTSL